MAGSILRKKAMWLIAALKLPQETPPAYGSLTKEQLDSEIERGMAGIREGRVCGS